MNLSSEILCITALVLALFCVVGMVKAHLTCKWRLRMIDEDWQRYNSDPRTFDEMCDDLTIWTYRQYYP